MRENFKKEIWMLYEDFNTPLYHFDRSVGKPIYSKEIVDFLNFLHSNKLTNINLRVVHILGAIGESMRSSSNLE